MSNCAFVQVRDIMTRKREKISPSVLCAEFRFRQNIFSPSSLFNIYKSRQSRRSTTSTSHYSVWSVVTDGPNKRGRMRSNLRRKLNIAEVTGFRSQVGSEHSIQHRFSTTQCKVHTVHHDMISMLHNDQLLKYVTHNMSCLSHNKTRKRLSINRERYNKVKSQHNITIQQYKMNLVQLIMT